MGYIGTYGTETTAPEYHCNAMGTPSWSGKRKRNLLLRLKKTYANLSYSKQAEKATMTLYRTA